MRNMHKWFWIGVFTLFATLVINEMSPRAIAASAPKKPTSYIDVSTQHENAERISKLTQNEILQGTPGGEFKGEYGITRVEFAIMVKRSLPGIPINLDRPGFSSFTDLKPGAWYERELSYALLLGVTGGFSDHTYRPDFFLSRQEAAVMMANALHLSGVTETKTKPSFADTADISPWAVSSLVFVHKLGLLDTSPVGDIDPHGLLTRNQAILLIDNLNKILELNAA